MTTHERLRDAAIDYAWKGWPVHPLVSGEKRPATAHGFHDATTDLEQIEAWWAQVDYNIGLAIPPGVVVIDVDPRNGGNETARQLVRELGPVPHTRAAQTRAGGQHYWLQTYLDPSRTASSLGAGVDVKISGKGYVVAPPSRVEPGGYSWLTSVQLAYLPESWTRRLTKAPRVHRAPAEPQTDPLVVRDLVRWECSVLSYAEEGNRNPELFKCAVRLAERGCLTADAERRLAEVAAGIGLDAQEIGRAIGNARKAVAS